MTNKNETCPHCKTDLRGEKIPEKDRHHHGNATHYLRVICHEIPEIYDGGLFYECPDCHGRWHRWSEEHPLRERAEPYVRSADKDAVIEELVMLLDGMVGEAEYLESDEHITACQCVPNSRTDIGPPGTCYYCLSRAAIARARSAK